MNTIIKTFKEKLLNDNVVIGPFVKSSDPAFIEIIGHAGFDFCILDMEHGPVDYQQMQNNIRAATVCGILPVIRVAENEEGLIGKALDIGALAVQIPQIETASQAKEAVQAAKFYPEGNRGVCRFVRAAEYSSMDRKEYFQSANDALVILQLEGLEAIKNIDSILEVEGIDIIFIGPYDLSQSLGVPGEVNSKIVIDKMKLIVDKARNKNITVGTFIDREEDIKTWKQAKVQYLSYSVDVGIFYDACRSIVNLR